MGDLVVTVAEKPLVVAGTGAKQRTVVTCGEDAVR